ncbi:MAG TPA: 30S ribosomal protein S17 [Pirellulaceae bacterium]|nr:30S ribosomal protein S17 [Pirellulaceae bacterium]
MPKRLAIGVVTRDKAAKTRRVEIPRLVRHPMYGKILRRRTVCYAHDEENVSKIGDTVEIEEAPPSSKLKRWVLKRVVSKAKQAGLEVADVEGATESSSGAT